MRPESSVTNADLAVPGGPRTARCCRASNVMSEARTTSSRSMSVVVKSRSMVCSLSRDGLMDARSSGVDKAIVLSLVAYSLIFYRVYGAQLRNRLISGCHRAMARFKKFSPKNTHRYSSAHLARSFSSLAKSSIRSHCNMYGFQRPWSSTLLNTWCGFWLILIPYVLSLSLSSCLSHSIINLA
jgi:hypothetical protein